MEQVVPLASVLVRGLGQVWGLGLELGRGLGQGLGSGLGLELVVLLH